MALARERDNAAIAGQAWSDLPIKNGAAQGRAASTARLARSERDRGLAASCRKLRVGAARVLPICASLSISSCSSCGFAKTSPISQRGRAGPRSADPPRGGLPGSPGAQEARTIPAPASDGAEDHLSPRRSQPLAETRLDIFVAPCAVEPAHELLLPASPLETRYKPPPARLKSCKLPKVSMELLEGCPMRSAWRVARSARSLSAGCEPLATSGGRALPSGRSEPGSLRAQQLGARWHQSTGRGGRLLVRSLGAGGDEPAGGEANMVHLCPPHGQTGRLHRRGEEVSSRRSAYFGIKAS